MINNQEKILKWLSVFFAELFATAILLYIGCLGCVDQFEHFQPSHLTITLGFGLGVMVAINIFGCVSMAHLNPVITLSAVIYKFIDIPTSIIYMVGQLIGAFLGYSLVRLSVLEEHLSDPNGFCVTQPNLDLGRAFVVEFLITFILIWVVCGVWDPRNSKHHDSVPLRFGLAVFILAHIGGSLSGGSMNPARSFAPALYNWNWTNQWLYWVAPFSASFIATSVFRLGFYQKPKGEVDDKIISNGSDEKLDA